MRPGVGCPRDTTDRENSARNPQSGRDQVDRRTAIGGMGGVAVSPPVGRDRQLQTGARRGLRNDVSAVDKLAAAKTRNFASAPPGLRHIQSISQQLVRRDCRRPCGDARQSQFADTPRTDLSVNANTGLRTVLTRC